MATKADLNWIDSKKLPTTKRVSEMTNESQTLLVAHSGGVTPGRYVQYNRDVNSHIQAKKGDGFWTDLVGNLIEDVLSYYLLKDINPPKAEAPAKADQQQVS